MPVDIRKQRAQPRRQFRNCRLPLASGDESESECTVDGCHHRLDRLAARHVQQATQGVGDEGRAEPVAHPMNRGPTPSRESDAVVERITKSGGVWAYRDVHGRAGRARPEPPIESTTAAREEASDPGRLQPVLPLAGKRIPSLADPDDRAGSHRACECVARPSASQEMVGGGESALRGNLLGDRHGSDRARPTGRVARNHESRGQSASYEMQEEMRRMLRAGRQLSHPSHPLLHFAKRAAGRPGREQGQACSWALSDTEPPERGSTSTPPVSELRRNSRPATPLSSTAFTMRGSASWTRSVTLVPAVT